ncbi:hypothetical protein MKQ68_14145 [Chitinophaga horti]|uniref:NHL repeat-containing protein n=1 Tax=Chitinophaga horti TaxID=2920382 RepID=A0ABY6IV41_9BACT|nr:hypothetical protein [Chitinophaga horti]UYQ91233.1 hypothetical protein MKQ68_14145 [Chitinophaga horti]
MKKLILLLAATMIVTAPLQAQLLKKITDKVNSAVQQSIDKSLDKNAEKTVQKPGDKSVDKTKEGAAAPLSFPPEANVVNRPAYLAIDSKDNMYVIDRDGTVMITPDGTVKRIHNIGGSQIVIDRNDNMFYMYGSTINKLKVVNGNCEIEYYGGDKNYGGFEDGDVKAAKFNSFRSAAIGSNGDIYFADVASSCLKSVGGVKTGQVAFEPGIPAKLRTDGGWDYWCIIRKVSNGKVTTLKNSDGQYLLLCLSGMSVDKDDNIIFSGGGISRAVRKLNTKTMQVSTMAGKPYKRDWCPVYTTGDTSKAELFDPGYLIIDKKGDIVYADNRSHRITKIADGKVITLAGNGAIADCGKNIGGFAEEGHKDGKALTALFNFPACMAYDSKGNLFIVDRKNSVIRKLTPDGIVSSFTPFDRSKADISN